MLCSLNRFSSTNTSSFVDRCYSFKLSNVAKCAYVLPSFLILEPLVRHPDFRLFACMNPATDVGKKNLPLGLRNR